MSGRRGLSDDEREVWATVTRRIKPLKRARKILSDPPMPQPARKAAPAKPAVAAPARPVAQRPVAESPPLAPLGRREKQRVARGRDRIDARLDLHGHTQDEAHSALRRFLQRASAGEARLVLVITGKSGVLRQQVPRWLTLPDFRALVISAETAGIRHGGEGALYIRVRRARG
jgi:DNA-nicking Smr family endonuclease